MSSFAFSDIYRLDINAALNVENGRRRLDYQRAEIDTVFSRNHTVWTPASTSASTKMAPAGKSGRSTPASTRCFPK